MTDKQKISIVIPVYNEEASLEQFFSALRKVTGKLSAYRWEYIFVDDGSTDNSLAILEGYAKSDPDVKVLSFSRNFGKEIALTAGLESVNDNAIIFIDSDLQHPPELIPKLVQEWEKGTEIVVGIRNSTKKNPIVRRLGARLYYFLVNVSSDANIVRNSTDFRLIDKKVVKVLKHFRERGRLLRGLVDWVGFKKVYVEFDASERIYGNPGYNYIKLIRLAVISIASFSLLPLRITGYLGIFIVGLSGLLLIFMFFNQFILHWTAFTPLAVLTVINTFFIGIVLCALGLLALYIGNIHTEVINRPLYIIRERINFDE